VQCEPKINRGGKTMKVIVKKVNSNQSVIEVQTRSGVKELVISKTPNGHSYDDFGEWGISDSQYYDLEKLVDDVMDRMMGVSSSLDIYYEE
jgi:hypothetical protein